MNNEETKCLMWFIKIILGAKRKPQPYHVPLIQVMISRADKSRHKSAVKRAEAARLMARWCCFVFVFVCCVLIVDWGSFVFDQVVFNHILNDVKVKWRVDKLEDAHGQFQWWLTWLDIWGCTSTNMKINLTREEAETAAIQETADHRLKVLQ